jgi:Tfp pilus assembly protein PilN
MKLRLNLATSPEPNNRPFLALAAATGTVGFLALIVLSIFAHAAWQSNRDMRADISQLTSEIQADRQKQQELATYFAGPATKRVMDRAAFLNSLIDERSFPWTKIFMDLEQTLPPGVRIVSIAPKLSEGRAQLQLEVGASSDAAKIQFLEAIEKSKIFSGMEVRQERRIDITPSAAADSPDKVVLELSVWYSTI